jgi:putative transposase
VDEGVKAGLLDLVDHAVERGWSARRAAALLGLDHVRLGRWEARRAAGQLADRAPGGHPLHGLLEAERAAIVALFEAWGQIDRSHRKLAHRGSRLGLVHVSESTVRRVLAAEGYVLPGQPPREPIPRTPGRTGWSGNPTACGPTTSPTSPARGGPDTIKHGGSTPPPTIASNPASAA